MESTSQLDNPSEREKFKFEKLKYWVDFAKWFVASVALVLIAAIIDNGFKERNIGIQEMQAFDKYVDIILKADNIEARWKLAQFFSTVTPTNRLRDKWESYLKIIKPDYQLFIDLKAKEVAAFEEVKSGKSTEAIKKLNSIKKQLEPFEKKLSNQPSAIDNISIPSTANTSNNDVNLKKFKEQIAKDSSSDFRYKLKDYFERVDNINNSVVRDLANKLGEPYETIQTGIYFNYNESTFSNQYGIQSKFDASKHIWPLLQVKFADNFAYVTLKEDGTTKAFKSQLNNAGWENIKDSLTSYFLNKLDHLR